MLRVLAVADVSPLHVAGGGERVLWEQVSRLARRGHRVSVVSRAAGDAASTTRRDGVRVVEFPVERGSLARFIRSSVRGARRAVSRELSAQGADVLHLHQPLSAWGVLGSPMGRRVPSLYTFHSPAPLEYRLRRGMSALHRGGVTGVAGMAVLWAIERACVRRATRVHVLSAYSAGVLRRLYGVPAERIVRVPGGVDTERFRPADRAEARRALGLPATRPIVLTLRNLEARMGLDALLHAVAEVRRAVPDVLLLVGGTGSLRAELEVLAASLDLGAHVRFLGFVADAELPRWYQAADVFVLPTRALEGFGLVTVEALASGTPVLGTPVGATPEILRPLTPSLLLEEASAPAIARGLTAFLARLARDPEGARSLATACRRLAETSYSWERVVDALEATLTELAR
ncbi:MAG: hypothetical protein A3I17_09700 [Candidatus Rokubacteria bacterium RIFCSPLOWO2_02_FULL_72_37]|nr:MAG: hypothetical protein A3I17_09700 [Candidatus Rokubacteria bacterium RIFCSPLOWO2_02_FULL_72_37]